MLFVEQKCKLKNRTESKMENPQHRFREMSLVFQFKQKSQIESKTVMS